MPAKEAVAEFVFGFAVPFIHLSIVAAIELRNGLPKMGETPAQEAQKAGGRVRPERVVGPVSLPLLTYLHADPAEHFVSVRFGNRQQTEPGHMKVAHALADHAHACVTDFLPPSIGPTPLDAFWNVLDYLPARPPLHLSRALSAG